MSGRSPLRATQIRWREATADRPIRSLGDINGETDRIEAALLSLVADEPEKVAAMNALLDEARLNNFDFNTRRAARLEEKIKTLSVSLATHESRWLYSKMPENALKVALARFRTALMSQTPPKGRNVERLISDLYVACDRVVDQRVREQITEELAGRSVLPAEV